MTKITKSEKKIREGLNKWKNFLKEGAFKSQVQEGVEPREGDYVNIIGGALTGAVGKVIELTTTGGIGIEGGKPAVVVLLTKDADKRIYGAKGDEVIVQPKFVEVDSGLYGAQVNEARMGEYGKMDAEQGLPPTKIGRGNEEYMAAYNAVLQARGEEPLDIQKPDQAYLDALRSGQLEESNMEMSLQSKAKGKAMGLLQTAKAMAQAPSTEPAKGFAAAVANAAGEIVDLMVELEGFQASRSASLEVRDAGMEAWMEKFKLHARLPQNQPMDEFMKDNAMYAYRQGMSPKRAAEELRKADAERDFPESGMELYDIDEKKSIKEEVIEDFAIELEDGVTFADVEEAGLVTPGVDSVIDNGDGYAQVYAEPGAMAKMAKTLEAMTGVMVSPESHGAVDEEMSKKDFVRMVRDKGKVPNLKGDMGPISGLEGPFQYRSGAVLYYDPKAGKYYDRGRDMYLDDQEAANLTMEDRTTMSSDPELDQIEDIARDMLEAGIQNSRIPVGLMSVASALKAQGFDATVSNGVLNIDGKYFMGKKGKFDISPDENVRQIMGYVLGYMG